jgi:hypothetical protein
MREDSMLQLLLAAATLQDYYPLGEGYSWQYEATIREEKSEVWKNVTGKEKVGGEECFVVEDRGMGGDFRKLSVSKGKNGVHVLGMRREVAQPFPWLKFPLEKGARWLHTLEAQEGAPKRTLEFTVEGEEEISVPAGDFKAQRVRLSITEDGTDKRFEYRMWYAPDVGEVKRVMKRFRGDKVDVGTLLLMKFQKGK